MRWDRICLGQRFVTVLTILILAISLSSYGCKDSVSVSEDVQVPLASLTVTPGTLQPGFFSNTTNYTVDAPTSATSVTVTAIPRDNTATVTINKAVTTHLSVPLGGPGSITTIIIALSSSTGGETTYTVNVTRLLSSDNNLSVLAVTASNVEQDLDPDFDANLLDYTVNVATNVISVDVFATKSDPNAAMGISWATGSVTIGPGDNRPGQADNIPLGEPGTATPVSIELTAPNGNKQTYQITINRLSGDNYLKALTVTANNVVQPLTPDFDRDIPNYTVGVATDVTEVTVTATKSDPNAVISGDLPNEGQRTISLEGPGTSKTVTITVTAQNGTPKQPPYTITVNRALPAAPPAPTSAPDLIPEDDSCLRDPFTNACVPPTSEADNITNVTTPRFRIPQPGAGETPSLYVDGNKDTSASFDSATNTLRPSSPLNVGTHAITYTLANTGGESPQSLSSLIVTISLL